LQVPQVNGAWVAVADDSHVAVTVLASGIISEQGEVVVEVM
jgi:hypothetical protein